MFTLTKRYVFFLSGLIVLVLCLGIIVKAQDDENDPVKLFNQGQDAHEKGDFKKAIEFYEKALEEAPEFPEAEYQKGAALLSLGKDREAETSYRRALELKSDWTLPMADLGELLLKSGRFAEADALLKKVILLDASNFKAHEAQAELYLKTKAPKATLSDHLLKIKSLTADSKATASTWAARGALERAIGDTASAKQSIDRALQIGPKNFSALTQSIEIYLLEKKIPDALINAKKLIALYPNSLSAKILLANVFAQNDSKDEALKILDSLDQKNPEVVALKSALSSQTAENPAQLESQLAGDPRNSAILGKLCILTRTSPAKAIEYCRRALDAEPSNIKHAVGYGAALVQAKQFDSAIVLFRRILTFEPDNYVARANLAAALFETKRYSEAKPEYAWIAAKNPNPAIAYYFLAICHDNLGEYSQALENYQSFIRTADPKVNQLEIDKVNLRLPILQRQIKQGAGNRKGSKQKK